MTTLVDERRFGVEIECGMPGGCVEAENLLYADPTLRHWTQADEYYDRDLGRYVHRGGSIHEDGSGVELSSPILQGEQGLDELRRVMEILVANGGYVTTMDGMHVHHDAPEFVEDREAAGRALDMWVANQELIDTLVHHRRRDNGACPKWNDEGVNNWKVGGRTWGRGVLNVNALQEHGTIEFRQHEGTLDFDTAKAWIKFGQSFLASALRRETPLIACATPKELLWRIRTDRLATAVLLAKDTEGDVPTPNPQQHDESYCDCDACYEERYGYENNDGEW